MQQVRIDNRIHVPVDLVGDRAAVDELLSEFTHVNPKHGKQMAMGFLYTKEPPFYKMASRSQDPDGTHTVALPRGGTIKLRQFLAERGLEEGEHWEFDDQMCYGKELQGYTGDWVTPQIFPQPKYELWEHQGRICDGIDRRGQCIIRSPTGSGKTWSILAAIVRANVPAIIVMNNTKLLEQWRSDIEEMLGIAPEDVGVIGGGKFKLKALTLAMTQSMVKMKPERWRQVNETFGFLALDECHMSAANTFIQVVDSSRAAIRVGVSDDETRADKCEFLIYDLFGAVEVEVTRDELVSKRLIHDVAVRIVPTDFCPDWHTEIRRKRERGEETDAPDFNRMLDDMAASAARNQVVRNVVAGCQKRNETTFVFSHRVDHCRALDSAFTADGHKSGLLLGGKEWAEVFDENKAALKNGTLKLGVGTYKAIGTGQNIPAATCGVAVTPIHSNRQFQQQVKGRICRKSEGKRGARLYVIWDRAIYGKLPVKNFIKWSNDTKVWDGSQWADAEGFINGRKKSHQEKDDVFKGA